MHAQLHALTAFRGPLAGGGILLFVISLTVLLFLMIYAVVRAPAWQPSRAPDNAGPRPGDRPAPLPRRARHTATSVFQPPLPTGQPARHAAASAAEASAAAAVPHPAGAGAPADAPATLGMTTSPAEPDPRVLERPVVTGRPPWGPAPRPPGLI
jgi:hypothetical protein